MSLKGLYIVLLIVLTAFNLCKAQTTVSYTAMGSITCPAVPTATISPSVSGLTFSQLSRGSGVACVTLGNGINGSGFNVTLAAALTGNKWYTNSITSDATVNFIVSSLSIVSSVSAATGSPSVNVQYSIGGGAKISIGSYAPTTGTVTYTITPGTPISVPASQTIDFFFIPNGLTASGTTCRIMNNTSFNVKTIPETQASFITFSPVYGTSMTINWTNGNGTSRIAKINTTNSFINPTNGVVYSANTIFSGSEQVIYNGSGNSVTVTGLSPGITYWFRVYEYITSGASPNYNMAVATNNPLNQITCNLCSSPGDYFQSLTTGNWSASSSWQSSPDNITWINSTLVPTSSAAAVTILNGHIITIDANASSPILTINNGGTLQANSLSFVTLTIVGNLINDGIFQMYDASTFAVNVVFNKNGNQSITGNGAITNFYSIGLNMGTTNTNVLDISSTNFSSSTNLLVNSSGTPTLTNGTLKFSGSYFFSNQLFVSGPTIPATAGIWLNNSFVSINAANYSYSVSGFLRITSGTFNVGSSIGNSIYLLSNSKLTIEGGALNVAARIDANSSGGVLQTNVAYRQSGGTVILSTFGQNTHGTFADFALFSTTDSLIMSGGTIIFRNEAQLASDIKNKAISVITGGTMQIGDALTAFASFGFEIESYPGSSLPSLHIDNSSALNPQLYPGTDIQVKGNITIDNGTTLDNLWDATNQYNFSLTGNWNNSGTFVHNNVKTVTFNGSSAQIITGATTTSFNNLTINNSSGGVTLSTPAIIAGTTGILTLTNGYLYTSGTNLLTMNAGTSTTGANNNSFVYGPMSKVGSTNFTFPVGKDLKYRPIKATSLSGSETFTAEYFHSDPDAVPYDVTLKDPTLDDIGRCEYWILNRAGAVNANVTLSWDSYSCGVTSLPDLAVARWDGSMWKDEGNTATTGAPDPATGTVTSGVVASFSPFTLASKVSGVNPLPVELLSFTANYNSKNVVDIKWTTASERNNDYFTIERSTNAIEFNELERINGAGNSTRTLNYARIDNIPLNNVSYYRLKQTDYNGDFKFSNIVEVQRDETNFEIISTDQFSEQLAVYYSCSNNCMISFELFDMTGKIVYSNSENASGNYSKLLIPTENLSRGIYLLKASDGSKLISKKIRVN